MKFLFDQNISYRILQKLPDKFEDSSHVKSDNLMNASDRDIWEFAKQNGFIIVTQDATGLLKLLTSIIKTKLRIKNTNSPLTIRFENHLKSYSQTTIEKYPPYI